MHISVLFTIERNTDEYIQPSYIELSKFYDSIVFLEDHNNNIHNCLTELKSRSKNTDKIKLIADY